MTIGQVQTRVLGPFEVRADDGVFADVPGARLRALLIALGPGHVVAKAMLVDWIWFPGCGRRSQKDLSRTDGHSGIVWRVLSHMWDPIIVRIVDSAYRDRRRLISLTMSSIANVW